MLILLMLVDDSCSAPTLPREAAEVKPMVL
jgi:hypothetical protein